MFERRPVVRPRCNLVILPGFLQAAMAGAMVCCALVGCSRRPAQSEQIDNKALSESFRQWDTRVQDSRARVVQAKAQKEAAPRSRSQGLMDAAQSGDAVAVKSLVSGAVDPQVLAEALSLTAHEEPLASDTQGQEVIDRQYAATARVLIEKGASIRTRSREGLTPLVSAAGHGETAVVKFLLEKGAPVNGRDSAGQTPLIAAACNCPIVDMPDTGPAVRLLLDQGADIEAMDNEGGRALMAAAAWGRSWIVQILIDHGASLEARDNRGNTALLRAASPNAYPTADAVELLLKKGADIEAKNNDGDTPLILAAAKPGSEDVKILKMLLSRGADFQAKNKQGYTALDLARKNAQTEKAAILSTASAKSR